MCAVRHGIHTLLEMKSTLKLAVSSLQHRYPHGVTNRMVNINSDFKECDLFRASANTLLLPVGVRFAPCALFRYIL
jgi:hypothetical protein